MSKAYLFASNPASQTITGGGAVDLGTPVHGFGTTGCGNCCQKTIDINGDNVILREGGYYDFDVSGTFSASAAGNVTVTPYINGQAVSGVSSSETVAANDPASFDVNFGVLVPCGSTTVVSLVATSTAGDPIVTSVSTTAEKIR